MPNCFRLFFPAIYQTRQFGLLAIFLVVVLIFQVTTVIAEQPSSAHSTRKSDRRQRSSQSDQEVRSAVAFDDEDESVISQVVCKSCQSNMLTPVVQEHKEQQLNNSDEVFEDGSVSQNDSRSSCDTGGCMPWGISLTGGCDSNCSRGFIDPCSPLGLLSRRLYMRAEAVSYWGTGQFLPTLVTTSNADPILPVEQAGLLGGAATLSLFGGGEVGRGATSGIRYEVGFWLDDCRSQGFLVRLFDSGDNDLSLQTDGTRQAVIARNFLDVGPPRAQSLVSIAYPNQTNGTISANLSSNTNGGDILLRQALAQDHLGRWDWLVGYQTARLIESIDIVSTTTNLNVPNPILNQADHFRSRSQFHGATLGLGGEAREANWYFGGLFKVGFGNMERRNEISGFSQTTVGTDVATQNQGLLARQSNIGTHRDNTFVLVPELGLHVGYRLTPRLDFTVGYSLLRLPKVARVVDTLDGELASNLSDPLTGEIKPTFVMRESNFTLHSLNLGLQWAY